MILKAEVDRMAAEFLASVVKDKPIVVWLFRQPEMRRFLELLHVRANEVDIFLASKGKNISPAQMRRFIENATAEFSRKQIQKRIKGTEDTAGTAAGIKGATP
jgi:hypothetical protein